MLDAPRRCLYVTNQEGTVTAYSSDSYPYGGSCPELMHPNSLALDAKNSVLYVSIKNGEKGAKGAVESVARIPL